MAEPAIPERRFPAATVRAQTEAILRAWGMPEDALRTTAEVMVETDLAAIDSHGVAMLAMYDGMQQAGRLRLDAQPRVVRESASTALIDGGAGLGHPTAAAGMRLAVDKALAHDVGVVSVYNSHHFGAAGYYAAMASDAGLIGVVSTSTRTVAVVPTNGTERVLGTNPLAFAIPAGRNPPVILDMSTSVAAANRVKAYALRGRDVPAGWVVDAAGAPVTDGRSADALLFGGGPGGGLTALGGAGTEFGGHKGYGLAVVVQILGSTLGGGSFSPIRDRTQRPSDPDNIGHFFMALNPAAFRSPEEFLADVDAVLDTLRAARPEREDRPVLIPGDPERAAREDRLAHGIPIPEPLRAAIGEIARAAGAPFLLGGNP